MSPLSVSDTKLNYEFAPGQQPNTTTVTAAGIELPANHANGRE
jgi:hypothetical protein